MNPRDGDPLTVPDDDGIPRCRHGGPIWACDDEPCVHRYWTCLVCGTLADRDRPGITIPLLLAIVLAAVLVVVVALAVWGGTR